jgi:hypothetical protein
MPVKLVSLPRVSVTVRRTAMDPSGIDDVSGPAKLTVPAPAGALWLGVVTVVTPSGRMMLTA